MQISYVNQKKMNFFLPMQWLVLLTRFLQVLKGVDERGKDARNLCVLVDENESVWNVVISKVDDRASHPLLQLASVLGVGFQWSLHM